MTVPALALEHLTKHFGATVALDDVSLEIAPGEVVGFLGPNGAGKSTALRVALGLLRPTSGAVRVMGHAAGTAEARARLAYVPGDVALWPRLSGEESLTLLEGLHGGVDAAYRARLIDEFDVDVHKRVRAYSKGNRQKIALVAAFASRADVLLLDEPTSGLDPLMERVFRECVSEAAARGQTVLLSSHILSEVEQMCARVAMIRSGRLVRVATIDELREHASVEFDVAGVSGDVSEVAGVTRWERTSDGVKVTITGSPVPLLHFLATQPVTAVRTREASLEEIFLSYYDVAETRG